ncbi:unnamed protein product [Chilo suppressalis]|uniref:Uncharacterized protein n=1 Tax=Chilo suppressalis TaxID=168631 RepID=A0ABN8AV12_CHISP|nr:unnamed protein product [Chilo suppressalis]
MNFVSDPLRSLDYAILDGYSSSQLCASKNNDVGITKLYDDLIGLTESISRRILNCTARVDVLTQNIASYVDPWLYMGYAFETKLREYNLAREVTQHVKQRCVNLTSPRTVGLPITLMRTRKRKYLIWNDIKIMKFLKKEPYLLNYKTSYSQAAFQTINM